MNNYPILYNSLELKNYKYIEFVYLFAIKVLQTIFFDSNYIEVVSYLNKSPVKLIFWKNKHNTCFVIAKLKEDFFKEVDNLEKL